ncbi:MAG TPA: hypothetical protein VFV08_07390, partial [Puia sp.]|nr:hypothetical protein [Puia sp.]
AIVAIVFCKPALEGKQLYQSDIVGYKAMAQQSVEFKEKYGHYPLWTESMFSGMPAYTIDMDATSKISISPLYYVLTLGLPKPISYFFLACICFYILTQVFRISPWLGILSALAYSYCTYDPVIIVVGHETKMLAIAYAPAVIAGLMLIFQKKYLVGAAVLALFMGLQASTQHLQIIYYTGIFMGLITICFLVHSWKEKQISSSLLGIAIALIAGIVGFSTYAVTMLPTKEYATETMRGGKSELSGDANNKTKGGLDKDYAFGWSYGVGETFTLAVPSAYGGGNAGRLFTENSKFADRLMELGVPEVSALQSVNGYAYWGPQPVTSGPVYLGAVVCFLFILGLVYVKGWNRWWIIAASILGILLAWGKNFSTFNYFLFDHLPYYNKFRAPSIALFIPQLTFPLLGAMGLQEIIFGGDSSENLWKKFRTVVYITVGLLVVLVAFYFMAEFKGQNDP